MAKKKTLVFLSLLTVVLATSPIFFDIYRTAAFNTLPRDDYAPYLLTLIGQGDQVPGAPFAYRIISVAIAIPFYYILPEYVFTNLSQLNVDTVYLKAIQALSFSSYVSLVLTAVIIYAISRKNFLATRESSLIVGLLSFFLSNFISKTGIDPFAILVISLLLLWLENPLVFAPFVLVSMGINEKIPIIFATIMIFRFVNSITHHRRFKHDVQLSSSCMAVVGYFAITYLLKLPGNETQTNPTLFLANLQSSLIYTLSCKGVFLNALPVLILSLVVILAVKFRQQNAFYVSDVSALFVLLILASIADIVYNIGRVVMYSYPLYLPAVTCFIDDVLKQEGTPHGTR